jgi:hypothetical protein
VTTQEYAETVLRLCPLDIAVTRTADAGGLRDRDWMPIGLSVKDQVMRQHAPREWARLPAADNTLILGNGSKIRFGRDWDGDDDAYKSYL